MTLRLALAWIAVWVAAMLVVFGLLPGQQSWPVEFATILGTGLASYVVLRLLWRRA
jgi:hypothetical protein